MACAKRVIDAFGTFRESADAVLCTVELEYLTTAGDDFMGIGLMSHIKYDLILRSVIYIMQSHYQFYCSKAWSKVPRVDGAALYHIMTELIAEHFELSDVQTLDVSR